VRTEVQWPEDNDSSPWGHIWRDTLSIGGAAAIGGVIAWALYEKVFCARTVWEITVWGTPSLIAAFFITIVFHIGFMGRQLEDERREWWSRLNAWLLIYALAWVAVFGLALYTPLITANMGTWADTYLKFLTAGWVFSTVTGLIAARSASTGGGRPSRVTDLVATVAPYIFVAGFFLLGGGCNHSLGRRNRPGYDRGGDPLGPAQPALVAHGHGQRLAVARHCLWGRRSNRPRPVGLPGYQPIFDAHALSQQAGTLLPRGLERAQARPAFYRLFA
jgi:hypothetical protein